MKGRESRKVHQVQEIKSFKEILEKTKYGKDGIGGIITKRTMYVGYPR